MIRKKTAKLPGERIFGEKTVPAEVWSRPWVLHLFPCFGFIVRHFRGSFYQSGLKYRLNVGKDIHLLPKRSLYATIKRKEIPSMIHIGV